MNVMQPIEQFALIAFLFSSFYQAARAIAAPDAYREEEVRFYKTGKPGVTEVVTFGVGEIAFILTLLHVILETPKLGQALLYAQVLLFTVMLPLHFMPFMRNRMSRTLGAKSNADYRRSGMIKVVVGAVMIALPFVVGK
jgi:hypothetical protein